MNKLKMESLDMTKANIDKIVEMFPQVVTEVADPTGAVDENGKPLLKKAIDFEKLKLVLSAGTGDYVVADDERERYEFTWVGKRQAMIDAATPIRKTLRPCPEESKDWATTENLYIEGDNLEVLKLLQESYLGKVKMIYIDPPYNTGKDFIYKDNFAQSRGEYEEELDMFDEEGNRLFQNTETNGRFHSDWCSMIYPRLQLARNLLTDDGVIFISIDDHEVENLKKICDEVFGSSNFVANSIWRSSDNSNNDAKQFSTDHNHTLIYSRNPNWQPQKQYDIDKQKHYKNPDNDLRGAYFDGNPLNSPNYRQNLIYDIVSPSGHVIKPPKNGWRWAKDTLEQKMSTGEIRFNESETNIFRRTYLCDADGLPPSTLWIDLEKTGHNRQAKYELLKIMPEDVFDTPKPVKLISHILNFLDGDEYIVMDFFSGSATTAHAVMQYNSMNKKHIKSILIQLPENLEDSYKKATNDKKTVLKNAINLCKKLNVKPFLTELGKERIRRAGAKIEEEQKAKNDGLFAEGAKPLDTGFRVFKLDTTNMKDVYYAAGQLSQKDLWDTVSNIKDDRSDIDLLYGCLLDWSVQLTMPHTTEQIEGFTVHTVDSPLTDEIDLIACFDSEVSETVIRTIAKRKPTRALFRDSSFADSANKINVFETFKSISPDTTVKVI